MVVGNPLTGIIADKSYWVEWAEHAVLAQIHAVKSARLTGLFARGTPRNDSDIDFRMKAEDVTSLGRWLKAEGRTFDSELPGHITVDGIEIFSEFHRIKKAERLEAVSINGFTFRTW